MKTSDFLKKLQSDLEIKSISNLEKTSVFRDLDEFNSMSYLTIIAFVDEYFGQKISAKELIAIKTVNDLINFIGTDKITD